LSTKCDLGFKSSKLDPSMFIYSKNGVTIFMLIYVDDIIVKSYSLEDVGSCWGSLPPDSKFVSIMCQARMVST
jgi:hypothetical protein